MPSRILLAIIIGGGVGLFYGQVIAALYNYIDVVLFTPINTILGG